MTTSRLLTVQEAAAYFRLPVKKFERLNVGRVPFGAAIRYDKVALDAHIDALSGLSRPTAQAQDNDDPEAALDRFMAGHQNLQRAATGRA